MSPTWTDHNFCSSYIKDFNEISYSFFFENKLCSLHKVQFWSFCNSKLFILRSRKKRKQNSIDVKKNNFHKNHKETRSYRRPVLPIAQLLSTRSSYLLIRYRIRKKSRVRIKRNENTPERRKRFVRGSTTRINLPTSPTLFHSAIYASLTWIASWVIGFRFVLPSLIRSLFVATFPMTISKIFHIRMMNKKK